MSPTDVARLWRTIAERCDDPGSPDEQLGAALLAAILTTGRSFQTLSDTIVEGSGIPVPTRPTLALGIDWRWWLPPGKPSSPQLVNARVPHQTIARPACIALPCTQRTRTLLKRLPLTIGQPFVDRTAAEAALHRTIAAAGVRVPLSKIERWLFDRIATMEGGDVALAALMTGRMPKIAQTVLHYTVANSGAFPALLAHALAGNDAIGADPGLPLMDVGSRFAPSIGDVRAIVRRAAAPLHRRNPHLRHASITLHNAMTCYTVLLMLFGTGCRPTANPIVDLGAIDRMTGFAVIDDKPTRDNFKSRLIWIPDLCRRQLTLYRAHQKVLAQRLPRLEAVVASGAPFLLCEDGEVRPLTRDVLRALLVVDDRPYPLNAGRHFLRSALVGKVASETLNAFLGHWHLGTEPWSRKAALDPLVYRAELSRALPTLLEEAGWRALPGLANV